MLLEAHYKWSFELNKKRRLSTIRQSSVCQNWAWMRHRLHWRGYRLTRFHDLMAESKKNTRFKFTRKLSNRFPGALPCDYLSKRCTRWWLIGLLCTSQPICAKKRNRFQNEAASPFQSWTEPNRFVNAPCLRTFSKRVGFSSGLDRRHVNERRNVIEIWAISA